MNCGTCRYFHASSVDLSPGAVGDCWRYPPTAFPVPDRAPNGFRMVSGYPPVQRRHSCGEYEAKLERVS